MQRGTPFWSFRNPGSRHVELPTRSSKSVGRRSIYVGTLRRAGLSIVVGSSIALTLTARADSPSSVPSTPVSSLPDGLVEHGFEPFEFADATIYPLAKGIAPRDVIRDTLPALPHSNKKSLTLTDPLPPDYRVTVSNTGPGSGNIGGLADGHVEKDVIVVFTDVNTNRTIKVFANILDYDGKTGYITATGLPDAPVRLVTDEGVFTGTKLVYSVELKSGSVSDATLDSDMFRVRGDVIEARTDGAFVAHNAMFTSCNRGSLTDKRHVPDYRISASEMTIFPNKYVSARRVVLYVGRQKTIPLPSFKKNLNTDSQLSSIPTPSYNKHDGLTMHLLGTPVSEQHNTFDYDVLLKLSRLPSGYFLYQDDITRTGSLALPPRGILPSLGDPLNSILEQFTPLSYKAYQEGRTYEVYPDRVTWYGVVGNEQYIFNRAYNNLTLSRLPEAGIHFANVLGKLPPDGKEAKPLRWNQIPYAPALLEAYVSFGVLHESPTGVTSGRGFSRINFATQPWIIGRRLSWRLAATNWLNVYTRGTVYDLLAPEVELDYVPTRTSIFNVGYRYLTDAGATPFLADKRDIRHELRLQYQVGGPYLFGITTKIDLEEFRAYDEEISIVRRLDCIQYGIAYHVRSQSFNVIINLLPARKPESSTK